jgi:hypothetical protein
VTRERWDSCFSKEFKAEDAAYVTIAINLLKIPLFRAN